MFSMIDYEQEHEHDFSSVIELIPFTIQGRVREIEWV